MQMAKVPQASNRCHYYYIIHCIYVAVRWFVIIFYLFTIDFIGLGDLRSSIIIETMFALPFPVLQAGIMPWKEEYAHPLGEQPVQQ